MRGSHPDRPPPRGSNVEPEPSWISVLDRHRTADGSECRRVRLDHALNPRQNAWMGTSFEQFRAVLGNDFARRAVRLDISTSEAERIVADPVLARAYYDNWSRIQPKVVPTQHVILPPANQERQSPPNPQAPQNISTSTAPFGRPDHVSASIGHPHKLGSSITGMVLAIVGYFFTGTWLSLIGVVGLGISIYAIVAARAARPRPGWKAGLTLGIIGTVAGGCALILFFAYLSGYYY